MATSQIQPTSHRKESLKKPVETISAGESPPTCHKCGQQHWYYHPCPGGQDYRANASINPPASGIVPNTIAPTERFRPTCKYCGKQHWPLDPSCIGKKGARAEAKARAKAQKQAEAEAKAKAKADARAKARADAEAKARAKKETKANARAQAKPYRGAPPEDIERIKAETEWAKVEIENAKAQAQTAIAEAQEAKAEVQKARAEAEKLRTDHVQIATTEKHAVPVSAQTTHATDTDAFLSLCAKDIMQKDVLWASPEESVQQALSKMRQYRAAYMMVGRDNMPAGIVSKSDLMAAVSPYLRPVFAKWRRPLDDATLNIKIKWAMTKHVRTISPEALLIAVLENMRRFRKRCLPVMDRNGKVQGLVTVFDIFQALLPDGQPNHLYHAQSAQNVTL